MSDRADAVVLARIRALNDAWLAAAARRDLDGMMAVYAEHAQERLPNLPPVAGRDAIRAVYAGLIERFPRFAHHFGTHDVAVAASGDLAVAVGSYRFTPDSGTPERFEAGKYVGVWRRRGGDPRFWLNISNGDGPPVGLTQAPSEP